MRRMAGAIVGAVSLLGASSAFAERLPVERAAMPDALAQIPNAASAPEPYETLARKIVEDLRARRTLLQRVLASAVGLPRLAVEPFAPGEAPVGDDDADVIHAAFVAALLKAADREFAVVARNDLASIFREAREFEEGNPLPALLKSAKADVLIRGKLRQLGDGVQVAFTALGVTDANVHSETGFRPVVGSSARPAGWARLKLDQAVDAAARRLAEGAPEMVELRLGGIRYADSGVQTQFGRYLEPLVGDALKERYANAITGRQLAVRGAQGDVRQAAARGLEPAARPRAVPMIDAGPDIYLLSGNYWLFEEAVDIRLELRDAEGRIAASWRERVRLDSVPKGLALRAEAGFNPWGDNDRVGPIGFTLTSARGRDPAYRIGETMHLLVRLGRPAWLYCFYRQSDGKTFKVFPNIHHSDARLTAGAHTVPGEALGFDFRFTEPPGIELLKCFALGRDVSRDLPPELRRLEHAPLPGDIERRLPHVFRGLRDAPVSEASLVVTVER